MVFEINKSPSPLTGEGVPLMAGRVRVVKVTPHLSSPSFQTGAGHLLPQGEKIR